MCDIPISQIGRRYHYVLRQFVDTVFFPPSIPAWILRHLKAHPPKWTWTIRAGTTLTVPTVPIHCSSEAHKAIKWIISVFHLFKKSLVHEETTINWEGRILPQLIHIYQNNMLLHIAAQMRILECTPPVKSAKDAPSPPSGPSPPKTAPTHSKEHALCSAEIAALYVEITDLRKKLPKALDASAPPSPRTVLAALKPTRPPSSPSSSILSVKSRTAHPDHKWLQAVLDHKAQALPRGTVNIYKLHCQCWRYVDHNDNIAPYRLLIARDRAHCLPGHTYYHCAVQMSPCGQKTM